MKQIIDGKMYNTETATLVGEYWNGYGRGDFNFVVEELYQKKNKEFFLYGEGGPLSKWSRKYGGNYCYGEDIIPMSDEAAMEWAQIHLDVDKYIEMFGEPEE